MASLQQLSEDVLADLAFDDDDDEGDVDNVNDEKDRVGDFGNDVAENGNGVIGRGKLGKSGAYRLEKRDADEYIRNITLTRAGSFQTMQSSSNDHDDENNNDAENNSGDKKEENEDANLDSLLAKERLQRDSDIAKLVASGSDLRTVARVYYSKTYQEIIARVRRYLGEAKEAPAGSMRAASQDEYDTILDANNIVPDIDNDIAIVHKYVVDHWGPRLPELFSLVRNAIDYVKTVKALGNSLIPSCNLREILPAPIEMVVTMSLSSAAAAAGEARPGAHSLLSTSVGRELTPRELACAMEGCDVALELETARIEILTFIEARMSVVSPNLSALVGTSVAARLLGAAGNLRALCRIPACNVLVLGQNKKYSAGLSNIGAMRHRGYVWDTDIVLRTSTEFRRQAARMVSTKVCLCARVDVSATTAPKFATGTDGSYGRSVREAIFKRIEKVSAAPPSKSTRALPVPDDAPKKRRGGRRARKQKEQYAVTEMAKAANRIEFNVPEVEVLAFDQIRGLGMLGSRGLSGAGSSSMLSSAGKVRTVSVKSKARTSEKLKQKLRAIGGFTPGTATSLLSGTATGLGSSSVSGTATSLSFTPVQGLEFADPQRANRAVQAANNRWFGRKMVSQNPPPS